MVRVKVVGSSTNTVAGVYFLLSMAAAKTKGFMAEPGWRSACTARLNWSPPRPPTMARIYPYWASRVTSAAWGWARPFSSVSWTGTMASMACSAACCMSRSRVV